MALNLARLQAIARGDIDTVTCVTRVTALQPEIVLSQTARCNASNVRNASKTVREQKDGKGRYDFGPAITENHDAGQFEADRRNRNALSAGHNDRLCSCGVMATVAIFDSSYTRGNRLWQCCECFEVGRAHD